MQIQAAKNVPYTEALLGLKLWLSLRCKALPSLPPMAYLLFGQVLQLVNPQKVSYNTVCPSYVAISFPWGLPANVQVPNFVQVGQHSA